MVGRRSRVLRVAGAFLAAMAVMLGTGTANASGPPGVIVGTGVFDCELWLEFPTTTPKKTTTSCNGWAVGAGAYARADLSQAGTFVTNHVGKPLDAFVQKTGVGKPPPGTKKHMHNFSAFNIVYEEVCLPQAPDPAPGTPAPVGIAQGDAVVQVMEVVDTKNTLLATRTIHIGKHAQGAAPPGFNWFRVGATAVVAINNAHMHDGKLKEHKGKSGAKVDFDPGVPIGVAAAVLIPRVDKAVTGNCKNLNVLTKAQVKGVFII